MKVRNSENKKRKRVLIVGTSDYLGGVETYAYNLVNLSKSYQYDFIVKMNYGEKYKYENELYERLDYMPHFHYVPLFKKKPIQCINILKRVYDENKYDVIYLCAGISSDLVYVWPYYKSGGAKLIVHSHSSGHPNHFRAWMFRNLVNRIADVKLSCSSVASEWLFGKRITDVEIIPNGIDTARFSFSLDKRSKMRTQLGISHEEILIGCIGRLSYEKNHIFALKMFHRLWNSNKYTKLLIIGRGSEKKNLDDYIEKNGLSNAVIILESTKHMDYVYSAMDVFIMPSHFEGLPIAGVEAQCAGLTCLFSESIDEKILITNRTHALPIDPEESCYDKWIKEILEYDRTDRNKCADIMREAGYDLKRTVERIEQIFNG